MTELNVVQMEQINGGGGHSDWCAGIAVGIGIISFFNPIAGAISGILWAASCWALA